MEFDFLLELSVYRVFFFVIVAIILDAVLGATKALYKGEFSLIELPRFLGTNVIPYAVGLFVIALAAEFLGEIFEYIFYLTAVAVMGRYGAKIITKIKGLFEVDIEN